jgi:hypothetical protein
VILKRHLLVAGILLSIVLFTTTLDNVNAQNVTANMSNTSGNVTAAVNQTVGEMGKNASQTVGEMGKNASQTVGEMGKNASQTVGEMGKNASSEGQTLLNQTGEVAKKIVGGAATVLGNISGEIKEGVGAK